MAALSHAPTEHGASALVATSGDCTRTQEKSEGDGNEKPLPSGRGDKDMVRKT